MAGPPECQPHPPARLCRHHRHPRRSERRNIDFSAGRGRNTFDYEVHDTVNASFGPQTGFYPVNQIYLPYSIFSPFGFNGRYAYGRIAMNF